MKRTVFTAVFLCFAALWLFNYVRVGMRRNTVYTSTEGPLLGAFRYALQLASVVAMLVYIVDPRRVEWAHVSLPGFAFWIGVILAVPALGLFGWVLYALGRNFSMTLTINSRTRLGPAGNGGGSAESRMRNSSPPRLCSRLSASRASSYFFRSRS